MRKCSNPDCGSIVEDSINFCTKCGSKTEQIQETETAAQPVEPAQPAQPVQPVQPAQPAPTPVAQYGNTQQNPVAPTPVTQYGNSQQAPAAQYTNPQPAPVSPTPVMPYNNPQQAPQYSNVPRQAPPPPQYNNQQYRQAPPPQPYSAPRPMPPMQQPMGYNGYPRKGGVSVLAIFLFIFAVIVLGVYAYMTFKDMRNINNIDVFLQYYAPTIIEGLFYTLSLIGIGLILNKVKKL